MITATKIQQVLDKYAGQPLALAAKELDIDYKFFKNYLKNSYIEHTCTSAKYSKRNLYEKRKLEAFQYKGGMRCIRCGINTPIFGLYALHHRDPTQKEFQWEQMRSKTLEEIKPELDKCDVLCHNCHYIVHYEERESVKSGHISNKTRKK